MVLVSSHLILIPIGVIILLESLILRYIQNTKTGIFVAICGIIIMGYGVYLLIIKRKDSTTLTQTQTETKLIKLAQYVLLGMSVLVIGLFQFYSPNRIVIFPSSDVYWHEGGIEELGDIELTFRNTGSFLYMVRFKLICVQYFRAIKKPIMSIASNNFVDLLVTFCELVEGNKIVKDEQFEQVKAGFNKLSQNNYIYMTYLEFFEIVAQIVVGGLIVRGSTQQGSKEYIAFANIVDKKNWKENCPQNNTGTTNIQFITNWCANVMEWDAQSVAIADNTYLLMKWMMIKDTDPANVTVICDCFNKLAATNAKLKKKQLL